MREVEDYLEPGEKLIWQGRPVGSPRRIVPLRVVGFFVVVAFPISATVLFDRPARETAALVWLPFPLLALIAFGWLWVLLEFRGQRFAITDRRVFALDYRGRSRGVILRDESLTARVEGRSVVLSSARERSVVRFEGLQDPEAALFALGQR